MFKKGTLIREAIKWTALALVVGLSLLHIYGNKAVWAPLDAYCPFGALETIWKTIADGGYIQKTQPSNLALGVALILVTILFGGIFCGWLCPLGTLQDGLNRLGARLRLPQIKIPAQADRYLRWLRLPVLILVLVQSFHLAKLWFADYDPFRIIFGLHWISEPEHLPVWSWVIGTGFIILSLFWRRFWCKYLCPLGLVVQALARFSPFRLRWQKEACIGCNLCQKKCPLDLNVPDAKLHTTACNHCLECVAHCPRPEALPFKGIFGTGMKSAVTGVTIFGILLVTAQVIGWWNPKIGSDPESIKGWMTLGYVADKYGIPLEEFVKDLGLPETTDEETVLRSLEEVMPNFEMEIVRKFVAKRLGLVAEEEAETVTGELNLASPGPEPKSEESMPKPVPTATVSASSPKTGVGDKSGNKTHPPLSKPSPSTGTTVENTNETRSLDEIKGSMSLQEVADGWGVDLSTLIEKLGLPIDAPTQKPIRELHDSYNVGRGDVQEAVKKLLNQ